MNPRFNALLAASALAVALGFLPEKLTAQSLRSIYSFTRGSDGANPYAGLLLSGTNLYGTACYGGASSQGTIFRLCTNGTGLITLLSFSGGTDGGNPNAGLVLVSNTLYGTAVYRGSPTANAGTVFKVNTDGSDFKVLHTFAGGDGGANPLGGLVASGNTLYGTTYHSSPGGGIVFAVNTDGSGFTNLYSFTGGSDGANPKAELVLAGNALYGTTENGGAWGYGSVFTLQIGDMGFSTLYSFSGGDGANPEAGLTLWGNTLFGTTRLGGTQGAGTVFALSTDAVAFDPIYNFTGTVDGANPGAALILLGNTLYGVAAHGGGHGNGTVFAVRTDGSGFNTVHDFTAIGGIFSTNIDGANPTAGLLLSGNTLYGTACNGGKWGSGTLFSLAVQAPPQLRITPIPGNVILTWPTNSSGFTLLSATNLASSASWSAILPGPMVVNGQNSLTDSISGPQRFYRLSQ
ncbi:MAG TPA: choice-of-anchor tandem repeat GloVer-containing protein [Candidatus Limnocylindrales bacterium]|nr:choice-of-anchor tandem repeat GloVer-containing protein [Candidatus Limnocylindrales bacterium]